MIDAKLHAKSVIERLESQLETLQASKLNAEARIIEVNDNASNARADHNEGIYIHIWTMIVFYTINICTN